MKIALQNSFKPFRENNKAGHPALFLLRKRKCKI
jgi:hypothetical protein